MLYKSCVEYLDKWITSIEKFHYSDWILLLQTTNRKNVEPYVELLHKNLNEANLVLQYQNLFKILKNQFKTSTLMYRKTTVYEKLASNFKACNPVEFFKELLKITQFYFSIIADNANVERFFSFKQSLQTKNRKRFLFDSFTTLTQVNNFNHVYDVMKIDSWLKKLRSSQMLIWASF